LWTDSATTDHLKQDSLEFYRAGRKICMRTYRRGEDFSKLDEWCPESG
jgi:hypothetical protein